MTATPGSSQVPVASTLIARGLSDNTIMTSADWASAHTVYADTVCLLPVSAVAELRALAQNFFYLLPSIPKANRCTAGLPTKKEGEDGWDLEVDNSSLGYPLT